MDQSVITVGNASRVLHAIEGSRAEANHYHNYLSMIGEFTRRFNLEDISPFEEASLVESAPIPSEASLLLENVLSLSSQSQDVRRERDNLAWFRFKKLRKLEDMAISLGANASRTLTGEYYQKIWKLPNHVLLKKGEGEYIASWPTRKGHDVLNDLAYLGYSNQLEPFSQVDINSSEFVNLIESRGKTNFEPFFARLLDKLNGLSPEARDYANDSHFVIGRKNTGIGMGNVWYDEAQITYNSKEGKFNFQIHSCSDAGSGLVSSEKIDSGKVNSLIHKFKGYYGGKEFDLDKKWQPSLREFLPYIDNADESIRYEITKAFQDFV